MHIYAKDRDGVESIVEGRAGEPMMYSLSDQNLVEATCGGQCSCATCHLYVEPDWVEKLPAPAPDELELLRALPDSRLNSRLACQIEVTEELNGVRVHIAPASVY